MIDLLGKPTWSKSRWGIFQECHRKFLLTTQPFGSRDERIKELKNLKNRHLWTASLVHEAVAYACKLIRQGNPLPDESVFLNEVRSRMDREFAQSQENEHRSYRLFEHEYGLALDPQCWQKQWEQMKACLKWFYRSSWVTRLQTLGPECWKVVDELLEFDMDGIRVFVKIDLALEKEGRVILIDWKSSLPREEDDQNLHVAALYANDVWDTRPDKIEAYLVSLANGTKREVPITFEVLNNMRTKILGDTHQMGAFLSQEGPGWDALPFAFRRDTCTRCNFQKICHTKG